MTLLRLALRSHRTGLVATAAIGSLGGLLNAFGFVQIAGTTHAERIAFAHQMELLGRQFSYILPAPVQLDTLGGYLTWRQFGSIAIAYAIWAVLAATGAARGDEERRLTELWLASGVSRARWLASRVAGFTLAALASIGIMMLLTAAGGALAGDALPVGGAVLEVASIGVLTFFAFGLGLCVAQLFVTRRAAALGASGVLMLLFLLNSAVRSGGEVGAARWLSPFTYFDRSAPLLAGGTLDALGTAVLLGSGALLTAVATLAFHRRDVGGALVAMRPHPTKRTVRPSDDPLLRVPVIAAVEQQRSWIAGWAIGLGVLAYFLVSITKGLVDALLNENIPGLRQYFAASGISGYSDFVGVSWFGTALLIVSIFVVVQVNGWASDDGEGRLALLLTQPISRRRVVLERIATLLVAVAVIAGVSTAVAYVTATANGIEMSGGRSALAAVLMLPVAFALGGAGHALVGWRPRLAIALLGIVTAVSYFTQQFAPIFSLPEWVKRTSVFALYGTPLSQEDWGGIAILIGMGLVGTAIAVATMDRRDVGT